MMQEHAPKDIQKVTKVRGIKIKGPQMAKYMPYSLLLVPGCALF